MINILKRYGLIATVILAAIVLLSIAYNIEMKKSGETITLAIVNNCKLQTSKCHVKFPDKGDIIFEISPKNPNVSQTIDLDVRLNEIKASSVRVKFTGKTMNMGFLEYDLKFNSTSDNISHYSGKGNMSFCILGKMEWIVTVIAQVNSVQYEIPFELDTYYTPGN